MTEFAKKRPRTFVNLIGAPLILSTIYLGGNFYLFLFFVVSAVCIYECTNLFQNLNIRIFPWLPVFVILLLVGEKIDLIQIDFLQLSLLMIVIGMIFPILYNSRYSATDISTTIFCSLWIGLFFSSIVGIRFISSSDFSATAAMFLSVWLCDSAAFVFGKQFGEKKIAPKISPKKTWVGSSSGLISVILLMIGFYHFGWLEYSFSLTKTIFLALVFGGLSQFGDFFESKLKREAGIKDSGYLLQGHGGFLDRFDSLMITAPAAYLVLTF